MKTNIQKWWFIGVDDKSKVTISGQIIDEMSEGFWFCQFYVGPDNQLSHARVISVESMLRWMMFPTKDEYDRYVGAAYKLGNADDLREKAIETVAEANKPISPKEPSEEEDPLALPGDENGGDVEADEYGFYCEDCEEAFSTMITPLPGEESVRTNCPHCGKVLKTAAQG